jgi:hypothetical protein
MYWVILGLLSVVLAAAASIVFGAIMPEFYPKGLPWFLGLVILITGGGQVLLTWVLKTNPGKFSSWFLIYKSVKLLIRMGVMLIFILTDRENSISFLISVFIIYLVYMLFEAAELNKASRKEAKR